MLRTSAIDEASAWDPSYSPVQPASGPTGARLRRGHARKDARLRTCRRRREERTHEGLHHLLDNRRALRVARAVVVLGGVGLQIEQLARRERVLVDDELVPVGLECGEAPVLADRHIARLWCRVVQVSEERPSLAVGNRRRTRDLAQRRGHVEVLDERIDDERIASSGGADDEWHADR